MTGTGLCETQYLLTLPIPGAPSAAPNFCNVDREPLVPTIRAASRHASEVQRRPRSPTGGGHSQSGRYSEMRRMSVDDTLPATNSTMTEI